MEFVIGKKIKLFGCEDEFTIEDIDETKIFIRKVKTGNKAWISNMKVEKILGD